MAREIEIRIRPDGTIHAETFGMVGRECLDWIGAIEDLCAAQTTDSQFKPEAQQTRQTDTFVNPARNEQRG